MAKHNILSGILVVIVILMIAASTYVVSNYATNALNAAVAFASTDQINKIQNCGITPPADLIQLRNQLPSLLQAIYVGFPCLMVILAILMFLAGYFHGGGGEARRSSETTITTSSPNRDAGGKYQPGRKVEKMQTEKSSSSEEK